MNIDIDDAEYQKTAAFIKVIYDVQDDAKVKELVANLVHQSMHSYRQNMLASTKGTRDKATYAKLKKLG